MSSYQFPYSHTQQITPMLEKSLHPAQQTDKYAQLHEELSHLYDLVPLESSHIPNQSQTVFLVQLDETKTLFQAAQLGAFPRKLDMPI